MAAKPTSPATADICLILEGTYPYVFGGVSTWVHQLLTMFPEWKFALFFLGAQKNPADKPKYQLPPNVTVLEEVYLFDQENERALFGRPDGAQWKPFYEAARKLGLRTLAGDKADLELIGAIFDHVTTHRRLDFESFWNSPETWQVLQELYLRYASDESFLNFFWTTRFLIQPLWKLARAMERMPVAKLYHTACTGYAGIAAALISARHGRPLLLTEHGIYLRERIADICRSPWIPDQPVRRPNLDEPLGNLRRLWIGFFELAGHLCYAQSSAIVSLFGKNARAQEHFGADPAKISIIPNGIRTEEFLKAKDLRAARRRQNPESKVVGFLGRVVSIKDVKTLLRAARKVCDQLPEATFLIAGPTGEEAGYHEECLELVEQLDLQASVTFLGPTGRDTFLPTIDVMILSSISEGLPFVIIESLAAGVPVVSTDVGACSELLMGRPDESPAFGQAGLIAEIGNSDQLARHVVRILSDPGLADAMTENGLKRVRQWYHEDAIRAAYHQLYSTHLQP
ncbi:MAG: pelF [Verrucomicrobiaceae bacterium]|nr:pelF [Verrucomicrobiaceae bacterium]